MEALVNVLEDEVLILHAMRTATARIPMIAIQNAHEFDPSWSNQKMVAHQNAHACRPNSILAKKMPSHDQDDVCQLAYFCRSSFFCIFYFLNFGLVLLGLLPLFVCSRTIVLGRFLTVATIDHCFGVPALSRIGERRSLEVPPWDLWRPLGLGKLAGLSPLTELRILARAQYLPLFFPGSLFARANLLILLTISFFFDTGPHRQVREDRGKGSQRRRSSRMRKG